MEKNIIYNKSSEKMSEIDSNTIKLVVTSPPYNIDIDYGNKTINGKVVESKGKKYKDDMRESEYRDMLRRVFNECKRVLVENGSIWINIKNRYSNGEVIPPFWINQYFEEMFLKNIIIWNFDWGGASRKRFSSRYEFIFWYTKKRKDYTFNLEDVKIPSVNYRPKRYNSLKKNPTNVWKIPMVSGNFLERTDHPAQYPEKLIERIILVGSDEGEIILDPFIGSGTTAVVAKKLGRDYIGYEIEEDYIKMAEKRLKKNEEESQRTQKKLFD